ncbi:hypothetical protein Pmar_PMAR009236 [Perkinsus marinus ATCC 50983]|uniref:Uncharacterized protein n=1 Tax=Perkinsus marinus (strain ATCC 50983 / TXsc) TaxID=423536 RepID=C5M0D2_PERM5|nr:hypothetical protein Pmar_PMAR009236 [Perkinsus marinus ATCC 50983]EEQ97539.1 hypothetical protein Pmar_PMAR009236 [Perkinsus marinus ATCC 50983]|eukprot:XP_002764822.1 hypothetical protein Pmar_PMAR009236 [Perkinsus marinus ATCC 50983]
MAVETSIPFTSMKPGQIILAELSCDADVDKVMAETDNDDSVAHGSAMMAD